MKVDTELPGEGGIWVIHHSAPFPLSSAATAALSTLWPGQWQNGKAKMMPGGSWLAAGIYGWGDKGH